MFKTRFISMLVLLMTAVTGAWADEPKVYASGEVELFSLQLGDIILPGVTLTNKGDKDVDANLNGNRYSIEGVIQTMGNRISSIPFSIGVNGLITAQLAGDETYNCMPITEDGKAGNAWVVTYIDAPFYRPDYKDINIGGTTYAAPAVTLTDGNDLSDLSTYAGQTVDVTYTRSFTTGMTSTVCLPFAYTKKEGDGKFYAFTNIKMVGSDYVATMTEPGVSALTANTPYLYMPNATGSVDFSGTYEIPNPLTAGSTTSGDWTFQGTYSTIEWTSAPAEPTYGFSAQDANDGITQGQFVKVGSYVRIKPMRAYLEYNGSDSQFTNARSLTRAAATTSDDTLPETIGVRLISANGEVNAIGTLYTRTGEVTLDGWYTLDGKRLSTQPTQKGIYVNNGKKVVIK